MALDRMRPRTPYARIGLGLAAVGRPGYINLGRERDLPAERTVEALRRRTRELLDLAWARGVRYVDAARSYGRAEEFLADWLNSGDDPREGLVVGSKWGYTYTADWTVDAPVHEVKDHSAATFDRQLAETRALLGDRLDLYQIHSVTPDSPALTDTALHRRLAELVAEGVTVGVSTSGPRQGDAIRAALDVTVDGEPLFRGVQATWNPLEPSAGEALAEAHDAGRTVIVKEALANGRLLAPGTRRTPSWRRSPGRSARPVTPSPWPRPSTNPGPTPSCPGRRPPTSSPATCSPRTCGWTTNGSRGSPLSRRPRTSTGPTGPGFPGADPEPSRS